MPSCRHCYAQIPEDKKECEETRACTRRVAKRLRSRFDLMVTKPFVGFNPDEAYKQAEKGRPVG